MLCYQEPETANHITLQCSYSRQIWFEILLPYRLHRFTVGVADEIATWWSDLADVVPRNHHKELNSLIVLVARCLWLERNNMVFDKFGTMPIEVCRKIMEEFKLWKQAGLCGVLGEIE
jgi:hypothetical protein